jgi:uncharacterized protein YndB with AHSA1/START domain
MSTESPAAWARAAQPKIVVERTYRAHVQELWDLWTTKDGFESWWGPVGTRVEVHTLEPRVGGAIHYDMIADAPHQIAAAKQIGLPTRTPARARFTEHHPHDRLAITHTMDFVPGVAPYDSTIAVEFHPSRDHVRMVITIDPLHDAEWTKLSTMGMKSQLEKLDARFEKE